MAKTLIVASRADEDLTVGYWVIQIVSVVFGLGIARLAVGRRQHRQVVA